MIDTSIPVTLGGLTFNGPAENGVEWTVARIEGLGGAAARYNSGPRVQQHGQWSTTSYLQGQAMGLEGLCEVGSAADIPGAIAALDDAVALHDVPLTMHWPSGLATRNVHRDGIVQITTHNDRSFAWACTVVADDPHWYQGGPSTIPGLPSDGYQIAFTALPSTSGGFEFPFEFPFEFSDVSVTGDFIVSTARGGWWTFTLSNVGPEHLVDPRIVVNYPDGSQRTLEWNLSLRAGENLQIDPQKESSLLQGQSPRPPSVRQWPLLTGGNITVQFRATSGTNAQLSCVYVPYV